MRLMSHPRERTSSHRLHHAMQLRGIASGAELARLTHQNEVTVRSHVNGTRDVSKRAAEGYSRALAVDPAWLLYGHGATPSSDSDHAPSSQGGEGVDYPSNIRPFLSETPDFRFLSKDVPVLGHAECGSDGVFTMNGEQIDQVRRPPGQMNRKGLYCIYASGSSMEPVYEQGDLVYVDPHRPPMAGRDVVIQLAAK